MTAAQLEEEAARVAAAQPDIDLSKPPAADAQVEAETTEPGSELALLEHGPGDSVMGEIALIPSQGELQTLAQMAVTFSASEIVPKPLIGKPNDILLVLLTARDLNLSVTVALRECHVIDGRVTVSPKLKLATIRSRGLGRVWPDPNNDHAEAKWYAQRADDPSLTYTSIYTWEQAQRAGLAWRACTPGNHAEVCAKGQGNYSVKTKCKQNWYAYPERMLSWRAVGYLVDDVFGEVGTGLYSPDELGGITDEDGNAVIDVSEVAPIAGMDAPRKTAATRNRARERQSGQTRQAEPPQPASDEDRKRLGDILGSLPPPALEIAKRMWGENHLGRLEHLPAKSVRVADSLLDMIVKRATAGEWGAWVGHPTEAPAPEGDARGVEQAQQGPGEPPATEGADPAPEPATAPTGEEGPADADLVCCGSGCDELATVVTDEGEPWCADHAPMVEEG